MTNAAFVSWLLTARDITATRVALRRAATPSLSDYAYPHLARWIGDDPWKERPTLLFAAAISNHHRIPNAENHPLGRVVAETLPAKDISAESGMGLRLVTTQRQTLPNAHRMLDGVIRHVEDAHRAFDWHQLWWMYLGWDHPDQGRRRSTRRRLLHDFFNTEIETSF